MKILKKKNKKKNKNSKKKTLKSRKSRRKQKIRKTKSRRTRTKSRKTRTKRIQKNRRMKRLSKGGVFGWFKKKSVGSDKSGPKSPEQSQEQLPIVPQETVPNPVYLPSPSCRGSSNNSSNDDETSDFIKGIIILKYSKYKITNIEKNIELIKANIEQFYESYINRINYFLLQKKKTDPDKRKLLSNISYIKFIKKNSKEVNEEIDILNWNDDHTQECNNGETFTPDFIINVLL